jgi:hypothetical protein
MKRFTHRSTRGMRGLDRASSRHTSVNRDGIPHMAGLADGVDLGPWIDAISKLSTTGADVYSKVEAAKAGAKPVNFAANAPAGAPGRAGASGASGAGTAISYALAGIAVIGSGLILWRLISPKTGRR